MHRRADAEESDSLFQPPKPFTTRCCTGSRSPRQVSILGLIVYLYWKWRLYTTAFAASKQGSPPSLNLLTYYSRGLAWLQRPLWGREGAACVWSSNSQGRDIGIFFKSKKKYIGRYIFEKSNWQIVGIKKIMYLQTTITFVLEVF